MSNLASSCARCWQKAFAELLLLPAIINISHIHAGRRSQCHVFGARPNQGHKAQQQGGPDISLLSPALQKQWDHAANAHLGNIIIKAQSHRKVAWKCDACPDGHPHQWTTAVYSRTRDRGCPQCSGRQVCKHNCLRTIAPWVAAAWDYETNAALGTPDTVVAHSHQVVGWHCQICGQKWTVSPNSRVSQQSGCPKCAPRGTVTRHPTFEECQHPLLAEWDPKRNDACGKLSPQHDVEKQQADILAVQQLSSRAGAQLVSRAKVSHWPQAVWLPSLRWSSGMPMQLPASTIP